jgi:hypothetical protein
MFLEHTDGQLRKPMVDKWNMGRHHAKQNNQQTDYIEPVYTGFDFRLTRPSTCQWWLSLTFLWLCQSQLQKNPGGTKQDPEGDCSNKDIAENQPKSAFIGR